MAETIDKQAAGAVPPWAAGTNERMHELDPMIDAEEMALIHDYGEVQDFEANALLWEAGDRSPMMVVMEGGIHVFGNEGDSENIFISHGPGHYVGETITMSGGRAFVSGRATKNGLKALVIQPDKLRQLIATESELGEKILLSFILRRMRLIAENLGNVTLIGDPSEKHTAGLNSFLSRNGVPFSSMNASTDTAQADKVIKDHDCTRDDLPLVIFNNSVLKSPSDREVADVLGFTAQIDCGDEYDLAVIGSGPAGLAAAVYAASEGLRVVVIEKCAPGGQAGSSSKIENYMGFPTGISGQGLMGRGFIQAQKFGARIAVARTLESLECGEELHKLHLDGGDTLLARTVLIASGAVYRRPEIKGLDDFGGVHYGASYIEAQLCRDKDIAVVGGGNSAGQAAVYLSKHAKNVNILIRGKDLVASMSDYLIQRINRLPNVHLIPYSEIIETKGETGLESVTVLNKQDDTKSDLPISNLFIFIGAKAGTEFVGDSLALDEKGFVLTGDGISQAAQTTKSWPLDRKPYLFETSCPRIFAAGDVRSGSVKRVASAVGEGSVCIQFVHSVLAEQATH